MGGLPRPGTVLILLLNHKDLRGKKTFHFCTHIYKLHPLGCRNSGFPRQMPHARTNSAARLYLAVEETSILHSAVWLIQLLVSVTHIFVPEPRLLLRWDLKQRPHLLLYCICRESRRIHFTALDNVQPHPSVNLGLLTDCVCFTEITRDRNVHVVIFAQVELKQVNFHLAVLDKHAMFNDLENQGYVQKSGFKKGHTDQAG